MTHTSSTTATQAITPALRQWIVEQAEAGHDAPSVLKAMLASGWSEEVAIEAMEATLSEHLEAQALRQGLPARSPVPEPALAESPLRVDAGDRQVPVLLNMMQPRVVVFGQFLSDEECDALIAAASPRLARSRTVATQTGGEEVSVDRTSDGMFFSRGESTLIQRIEQRIARLLNWPVENGEGLQVLHYQPGAEYKPHYDYFDPNEPGTPPSSNAAASAWAPWSCTSMNLKKAAAPPSLTCTSKWPRSGATRCSSATSAPTPAPAPCTAAHR